MAQRRFLPSFARSAFVLLLIVSGVIQLGGPDRLMALPPTAAPLPIRLTQPPVEPPGPSSRRSGVTVSEIHYHPAPRTDGRVVEFIEVYNSMPWFEELGGWKITGSVDFTFPEGFVLPSQGYVAIAASPADLVAVTGATNVLGPYSGSLPHSSGSLKLRHRTGAVFGEYTYADRAPWPAAADGYGPSLILARPSIGSLNPGAWEPSRFSGGSPSRPEPTNAAALPPVRINELLAPAPNGEGDAGFVELINLSDATVTLAGMTLSDVSTSDRYVVPKGITLSAGARRTFTASQLGFSPSYQGGTLCLRESAGGVVVDLVRYGPLEPGIAWGRIPDGGPRFGRLAVATPGIANANALESPVIFNEVMYHPPGGNPDDEFIELHNPGSTDVDLSGWKVGGGISATLPAGTRLAAGGYGVLTRNADRLLAIHPKLNASAVLATFTGGLSNSGESLELLKPVSVIEPGTNTSGTIFTTNQVLVQVEEFTYGTGGRWGKWSDGGGSSLELIHPRNDRDEAASWADSDETHKSDWVTVESTGNLDNGASDAPTGLELLLYGPGECLLDQIEVISVSNTNLIANAGFESGTNTWAFQGNHGATSLEEGEGFQSTRSLHVRASGAGTTGPNRVRTAFSVRPTTGKTGTIRAKARWLKGSPNLLLRLHGNWLDASTNILATRDFGTPGAPNSRRVPDPVPSISGVRHDPILPTPSQAVRVVAHAGSANGLNRLSLFWRVDPTGATNEVVMSHHGGGVYSGVIPGQANGAMVAYRIEATDAGPAGAAASFPSDAPVRECLIRWGDTHVAGALGGYHVWMTQATFNRWSKREKLSNDPLDVTVAYGNSRVIYNAGGQYSGSPYHAPSYSTPTSANCDYLLSYPADDSLLGEQEMELLQPGNGGGDATCQGEQHAYWLAEQLGIPACHRRPIMLYVNGVRRGIVYDDAQQPGREMAAQWFPDDPDGEVHKIQLWFEFDATGSSFNNVGANLARYTTTGGVKKTARYRWTWPLRAFGEDPNNYTNLFRLVDAVNTSATGDPYTRTLLHATDVDNWFRTHVVEHLVGNNDSYSYGGGQNMYAYKPQFGPWKLMIWDIDFAFSSADARSQMDNIGGREIGPVNTHPPFTRLYWQAMQDAANGPLRADRSNPIIDARYNGIRTNGATTISSGSNIKSFIANRRSYLLGLLTNKAAPLSFVINGGTDFTATVSPLTLSGTAPLEARKILLNGSPIEVTWTTLTNWTYRVGLKTGTNSFVLAALDATGNSLTNRPASLNIRFEGASADPTGLVAINELLPVPAVPGTGFIELANRSPFPVDLSGWRLDGVGFTFPTGSIINGGGFGVLVEDPFQFADLFLPLIVPLGVYPGRLSPKGETLRLVAPGVPPLADVVVDTLTYGTSFPWPDEVALGASLQRTTTKSDHNRVVGWNAVDLTAGSSPASLASSAQANTLPPLATSWPNLRINELLVINQTGATDSTGQRGAWMELFNDGPGTVTLTNLFLSIDPTQLLQWRFPLAAKIAPGGFLQVWLDQRSTISSATEPHANFKPEASGGTLYLSQVSNGRAVVLDYLTYGPATRDIAIGSLPDGSPENRLLLTRPTPNASNSGTASPLRVRINEWMARNDSTIRDPADGAYNDWFELVNLGTDTAQLGGCFLSTSTNDWQQFLIPAGFSIPAGGRLLVWADKKPGANTGLDALHTSFKLSASGGDLGLFAPNGVAIDLIHYGAQIADVSEGRVPEGGDTILALPGASPGSVNQPPAPVVFAIQVDREFATVSWSSVPGLVYQLEGAPDLAGQRWSAVGTPQTAGGNTLTAIEPLRVGDANGARFYRVRITP